MAYSTENDIKAALPEETIIELTDDNEVGVIDPGNVAEAILKADGEIDSFISSRYTVPLAAAVPAIVKAWSVTIAIYYLYARKTEEIPETRWNAYREAKKELTRVEDGKKKLPVTGGASGISHGIMTSSHF